MNEDDICVAPGIRDTIEITDVDPSLPQISAVDCAIRSSILTGGNYVGTLNQSGLFVNNTISAAPAPYTISTSLGTPVISSGPNGNVVVTGELTVGGKNIGKLLDTIEQRLAILHPNVELEDRWEELKELADRYRELEKNILEKERIWSTLKK
jgi:hypothetical protein